MIDRFFGQYKNILLVVFSIFIIFVGLRRAHFFFQDRIREQSKKIETKEQIIQLASEMKLKQVRLARLSESFISPDSFKFINLISGFAGKAGLKINSLKYVPYQRRRSEEEDETILKIPLDLLAEGRFKNMMDFIMILENSELITTITQIKIQTKQLEPDKVQGDMEILGIAVKVE